jgi:DNA repair protein RadA/Sms
VSHSKYANPQQIVSGIDHTQAVLKAAILEKHLQIKLTIQGIFFKISGTFKIKTAGGADLGIALALLSSSFQKPLPEKSLALGEVSLTGQIKALIRWLFIPQKRQKFGIKQLLPAG